LDFLEFNLDKYMKNLRETLVDCGSRGIALGHFNISDLAALNGIVAAARELNSMSDTRYPIPVLIGVSEGEREFIGVKRAVALVKSLREEFDMPIFLNADHTHSFEKVKEAAEAGFDEILFDGSGLPFEENIKQTAEAVKIIRGINPEIVIEGEIGYIGSNSEIIEKKPDLVLSTPEEAVRFVAETGVDVLAPAVGNMHGLLKEMAAGTERKHLDIELIKKIKAAIGGKFMTLHGGSGTADEDFAAAIAASMTIIHVSTELRLAWRRGIEASLAAEPNELAPYKLFPPVVAGIKEIVLNRLKLFNGVKIDS
jgi:fructose-bisphosphate aldolase class II